MVSMISTQAQIDLGNSITLDDGSKFTRVSPTKISIEKDDFVCNSSSDIEIFEVGNISKTKEWEYKFKGKNNEIPICIKKQ